MALDPWSYANKTNTEYAHQVALFMWANMAAKYGPIIADDSHSYNISGFAQTQFEGKGGLGYKIYSAPIPLLSRLHAIKNQGHGDAIRGAKSAAEGVKAGVPDVFLPVPTYEQGERWSQCYFGLYIELKRPKTATQREGKTSNAQDDWIEYLTNAGYKVVVCYGWIEARDAILNYLKDRVKIDSLTT